MTSAAGRRATAAVALALLLLSGCATSPGGPQIIRGPVGHPVRQTAPNPVAPLPRVALGPAPRLHRSWRNATLTATLCGVTGPVRFVDGAARATSALYGPVELITTSAAYGKVGGSVGNVAVVGVICSNLGGTADGEIVAGAVVVSRRGGSLYSIGELAPQVTRSAGPVFLTPIAFRTGTILVRESWSRSEDATCCPSGRAETLWTVRPDGLHPGLPHVTN